jgi:hypothetical protein
MKLSDDQSAVAFCDGTSVPELKLSRSDLTNRLGADDGPFHALSLLSLVG